MLVPFQTILDATKGDEIVREKVLKQFKRYIITLTTRRLIDESCNTYFYVDDQAMQNHFVVA